MKLANLAHVAPPKALAVGLATGGVAAGLSLQPTFSPRSTRQQAIVTGGSLAAGVGVGAGVAALANRASGRIPGGAVATFGALAVGGFATQAWSNRGDGLPSPVIGGIGSAGTVLGAVGGVGLAVLGARSLGRVAGTAVVAGGVGALGLAMHGKDSTPATPPSRVTTAAQAAAAAAEDRPVVDTRPQTLASVSGGANSTMQLEDLGKQGWRYVHGTVPGERIREVMGDGVDPIRVYSSLATGDTPQARVDAAMAEAEQLGTFDGSRKQVIVATPTGSGFIDPPSIQAAEYMGRGATATIAIQYADKPSIQATGEVPTGAETTKLLLEAVQARIAKMPAEQRPEVTLFGESLGAWAQQEVFEGRGTGELDRLGVDRSLWVGTPHESGFAGEATAEAGGSARRFDRIEEFDALDPAARAGTRHVQLTHANDPVSVVNKATLAFQRPEWLPAQGDKPNGVPKSMHYVPGVSLGQGIVDLINGTHPAPGKFEAHAHDYRADLPEFVRAAYGHADPADASYVSDDQVAAITADLVQLEKNRAALMQADPTW